MRIDRGSFDDERRWVRVRIGRVGRAIPILLALSCATEPVSQHQFPFGRAYQGTPVLAEIDVPFTPIPHGEFSGPDHGRSLLVSRGHENTWHAARTGVLEVPADSYSICILPFVWPPLEVSDGDEPPFRVDVDDADLVRFTVREGWRYRVMRSWQEYQDEDELRRCRAEVHSAKQGFWCKRVRRRRFEAFDDLRVEECGPTSRAASEASCRLLESEAIEFVLDELGACPPQPLAAEPLDREAHVPAPGAR